MRHILLLFAVTLAIACSSGNGEESVSDVTADTAREAADAAEDSDAATGADQSDGVEEVEEPAPNSYQLTLTLEMGPGITCGEDLQVDCFDGKTCCLYEYERDLTGLDTKFAFGSTHIAPAISLAMTDTMYNPTFAVITLNFGIIIGTSDKPPATSMAGEYDFSGFEPEVEVTIHNKEYTSKVDGSQGTIVVTDWAAEKGGKFAGTVEGTILQNTEKPEKLRTHVVGSFDFILPEPAGGQPGG